jgi:acyl carrier protein
MAAVALARVVREISDRKVGEMMLCADIEQEVREFLKEAFFRYGLVDVRSDDSLLEKGIVDSTGILNVVSFIEERFEIAVGNELLTSDFDSIGHIAAFVQRRLSEKPEENS